MIQKILNKKVLAAAVALTAASGFFFSQNNALSPVPAVHAQSSVQLLPDFTKLVEEMVRQSSALTLPKQCQRDRILHWTEFQKINSIS